MLSNQAKQLTFDTILAMFFCFIEVLSYGNAIDEQE